MYYCFVSFINKLLSSFRNRTSKNIIRNYKRHARVKTWSEADQNVSRRLHLGKAKIDKSLSQFHSNRLKTKLYKCIKLQIFNKGAKLEMMVHT